MIRARFIATIALTAIVISLCACDGTRNPVRPTIRIGCKNFTEQFILGELMAQIIEMHTDLNVERNFNLGGTMICHEALKNGEIDLYAEYTGTALIAILKRAVINDPDEAYKTVKEGYEQQFGCQWLEPFGFNNTYAIAVRQTDTSLNDWRAISDLQGAADTLRAGFTSEFMERPDGYEGLKRVYGFAFASAKDLDPGLMYQAIARNEVDVICAFATDGRIAAYELTPLTDDKSYFPPYYAAPVIRKPVLQKHPELRLALAKLLGRLDDITMQQLNYEVDEGKRSPASVAREFLRRHNPSPG